MAYAQILYAESVVAARANDYDVRYSVVFGGSDVGRVDYSTVVVTHTPTETPAQARVKLGDAVVTEGQRFGYTMNRATITLPTPQKA